MIPPLRAFWFAIGVAVSPTLVSATPSEAMRSVVSVLPVWPGHARGGGDAPPGMAPPGMAPEGSGVAFRAGGIVATAWHVIAPATRIDVRLADGRILPAEIIAKDVASDIALLRVDAELPVPPLAPRPELADPACAIGNAYGLDLSITCGVVSALDVSEAGFNGVEDFVQTDAASNPGVSGGALVDRQGRLLGMMSAIFASKADANIGVNFAVSTALLTRVGDELLARGSVDYRSAGWRLARAARAQSATIAGALVVDVAADSVAARAGVYVGDMLVRIDDRAIRKPRDAVAALAVLGSDREAVEIAIWRDGAQHALTLSFAAPAPSAVPAKDTASECPYPAEICRVRQAVFPVSSFDPLGSAVRISADLLVTNRHIIGDRRDAEVYTPNGLRKAVVVDSAFPGDLALLRVDGLPEDGAILSPKAETVPSEIYYAVGADIARRKIRIFAPGAPRARPDPAAPLGRLHVAAEMQPGVSGGALVNAKGDLVGVAVGGGGRSEAIPAAGIAELLRLRGAKDAAEAQRSLGAAFARCAEEIKTAPVMPDAVLSSCRAARNPGQLLGAGRALAASGDLDGAIEPHNLAVELTPNSLSALLTLSASLSFATRYAEMPPHARRLQELAPADPEALRFVLQAGVWGDAPELAEQAYQALLSAAPDQAAAARRFIDAAPAAPVAPVAR